jgi:hypothetical protein
MANIVITSFTGSVTAVPGQNTTFSVVASANFTPVTYKYQWKVDGSEVSGATNSTYFIDPVLSDNGTTFSVLVSGLSAGVLQDEVESAEATLTVVVEEGRFAKFARGSESGEERFRRLRNLGYI